MKPLLFCLLTISFFSANLQATHQTQAQQRRLQRSFFNAAGKGDIRELNRLAINGAQVNAFHPDLTLTGTALYQAVFNQQYEAAKYLIENLGADVNASRADDRLAPLHVATAYNDKPLVALLLSHGAKVDSYALVEDFEKGVTSLELAIDKKFFDIALLMLEKLKQENPKKADRVYNSLLEELNRDSYDYLKLQTECFPDSFLVPADLKEYYRSVFVTARNNLTENTKIFKKVLDS